MVSSKIQDRFVENNNYNMPSLINNNTIPYNLKNNNLCNGNLSSVAEYYRNSTVFITGSTGFVGKAVLEKLLRSCDGIKTIYVLIRAKRGLGCEQRLKELIKNPVFDRVREKDPKCFEKVKALNGDVTQIDLGLNKDDKEQLLENATIVFHSAANVRFDETLKEALILNTLGTKRLVEICKKMKKLKSLVHVSTAYCNADKSEICEMVYQPSYDPKTLIECLDTLGEDAFNIISKKLLGDHPNTYTLTKAMAEYVVAELAGDLPVAIVRPSIVTAAWKEPFPGWVDNISGINGIMMEIGRGTIRSIICDDSLVMDLIPVDIVANMLINVAWHTSFNRSNSVRVYNCTSGQLNGIKWYDFGELTKKYARLNPTKYVIFYPNFKFRTNEFMHSIIFLFSMIIPTFIIDLLLRLKGAKPIMLQIVQRFKRALRNGQYFTLNEWKFQNENVKLLLNDLRSNTYDSDDFHCDITQGFEWDPYVKVYMLGIRKYVLKDDLDSLPSARSRLQKLYWAGKVTQVVAMYLLVRYTLLR